MITICAGVPGSGKSYYAVYLISKLKDQSKVLHNVEGLKLGIPLDEYCVNEKITPESLFTTDFHDKNSFFRGFLFVLDECQIFFPKSSRNELHKRFFQLHRHYGLDIVLLTQDFRLVSPAITALAEIQLRAVSDTANPLPKTFMYKKMVGGEQIGRKFILKKQAVFDLYKTADFNQKKVRKKSRPMLIIFIVCILIAIFGLYKFFGVRDNLSSSGDNKVASYAPGQRSNKKPKPFAPAEKEIERFPLSLASIYHGYLLPVSTISDFRGLFVTFMGFIIPAKDFPYQLVALTSGFLAVVPKDVYDSALLYRSSIPESEINMNEVNEYDTGSNEKHLKETSSDVELSSSF